MEKLKFNIAKYTQPPTKKYAAYEWQDRAAQVIKELNVPKQLTILDKNTGKEKTIKPQASFFKWFKTKRSKAESCYRYIIEKEEKPATPWLYFCWMMTH